MSQAWQKRLDKNKIRPFDQGRVLFTKELDLAEEDLKACQEALEKESYKWATIQAYYSMFHSARALIYAQGYREKSHWCLIVAIRELFVKSGKVSHKLVEALQLGKNLREAADYYGDWSKINAKELMKNADEFLHTAKQLLQ